MGRSDGRVIGTTKIVDHGSNNERWNMVIMGDGYRAADMAKYHADVQQFLTVMRTMEPYGSYWCAINVHRVDVVSNEAGADRPAACGGDGSTKDTYFDARYCFDGLLQRLLSVDESLAQDTAEEQVPEVDVAVVVVNDTEYGGAGGPVMVFAANTPSFDIALHELGHTAFQLGDEYENLSGCSSGESGHDLYTGAEPTEPNVTTNTNRATIKWSALVDAVNVPTTVNPDPTKCDTQADPEPGKVGAYDGARFFRSGIYRPQFACKMRYQESPGFCVVCKKVIADHLAAYMPDESIDLITSDVGFDNIPEGVGGSGVTTQRAIIFDVVTCAPKTLSIVSPLPPSISAPFGTSVQATTSQTEPFTTVRLWLSYTSTGATVPAIEGQVTVECDETGQLWTIDVRANTVARPKAALVLVLDRSGSMADPSLDGTPKVDLLREAAGILVDVMLPGDALGIVAFNGSADTLLAMVDVGPEQGGAGRAAAQAAIQGAGLDPDGVTSVGSGLELGSTVMAGSSTGLEPYDVEATLVMTDGKENRHPFVGEVSDLITTNTFAVGLGAPNEVDTDVLSELAADNGGYMLLTGGVDNDQRARLQKFFLQILAGVQNAEVVLDPNGNLGLGSVHEIPFRLTSADHGTDVLLLSPFGDLIVFKLQAPDGTMIAAQDMGVTIQGHYVKGKGVHYYRLPLPAKTGVGLGQGGRWIVRLELSQKGIDYIKQAKQKVPKKGIDRHVSLTGTFPYSIVVHAYSDLRLAAQLSVQWISTTAPVYVFAQVTEFTGPLTRACSIVADILDPLGGVRRIRLSNSDPGYYKGMFTPPVRGLYQLRIRASGRTLHGDRFTREKTLSFALGKGFSKDKDKSKFVIVPDHLSWLKEHGNLTKAELGSLLSMQAAQLKRALFPEEPIKRRTRKKR
jgi:hypothetical protein